MITIAIISALFSLFLEKCMESGMIFWRYRLFLSYHWMVNWRKKDRWKRFLLKPLGLCIYCFSTWVCILVCLFYKGFGIAETILSLGINYATIEIWERKLA